MRNHNSAQMSFQCHSGYIGNFKFKRLVCTECRAMSCSSCLLPVGFCPNNETVSVRRTSLVPKLSAVVGGPRGPQLRGVCQVGRAQQRRHAGAAAGRLLGGERGAVPELQVPLRPVQGRLHALQVCTVQFSGVPIMNVQHPFRGMIPELANLIVLHRMREALPKRRQVRQRAWLLQEGAARPPPEKLPLLPPRQGARGVANVAAGENHEIVLFLFVAWFPQIFRSFHSNFSS